ncbi:PASTA domain-containing protein [Reyranella sp.]|uniref:Stk1 family PASTA domain-containing Ser/Thr kinase n=1 Tax=Reyranella sp. TaxID=1929291 RepID=UPI003D12D5A0
MAIVEVPNLTDKTRAEAEVELTAVDLVIGAVSAANNDTVPADRIVSTDPAAGTKIEQKTSVALVLSSGPKTTANDDVEVPDLTRKTRAEADVALSGAGLVVGAVSTANSDTVSVDLIVSTDPPAGTKVMRGTPVALAISAGPKATADNDVVVPDLTRKTRAEAEAALKAAGFAIGAERTATSDTVPANAVVSTDPAAGAKAKLGAPVALVFSAGPATVADADIPDVTLLTQAAAETVLKAAGLTIGTVSTAYSDVVPAGGVISINPPATAMVKPGTPVALVLSAGSKRSLWAILLVNLPQLLFGLVSLALTGLVVYVLAQESGNILGRLANKEVARGVITFLFAVTTVVVALILALSTVISTSSADDDKRFDRGKQVLTLLIGILGTIVGFYFGADAGSKPPLEIATNTLPDGMVGAAYSPTMLQAKGGSPPLKWSVTSLPAGLTLDSGIISGTPKAAGRNTITLTAIDSAATSVTAQKEVAIEIRAALEVVQLSLPDGAVTKPYPSTALQAKGGKPPLQWSMVPGSSLPDGLNLDSKGTISGTSSAAPQKGKFTVTVTDSAIPPAAAQRELTLEVK